MSPSTPSFSPPLNLSPQPPRAISPLSIAFTPNRPLTPLSTAFTQTHQGGGAPLRQLRVLCGSALSFACRFFNPLFSYPYELLFPEALYFDNHPRCPRVSPSNTAHPGFSPPLRPLCFSGKLRIFIHLQPLCRFFSSFFASASFVFISLQPLFQKTPGWGWVPGCRNRLRSARRLTSARRRYEPAAGAHRQRRADPSYSKRFGTPDQAAPGLPVRTGAPK